MSSLGQAAGGIVGGIIGFMIGGPSGALYGAQAGIFAGGIIDPAKIKGPRLEDLTFQTSTYGTIIPRVYGTVAITGNVIWLQNNQLTEVETTQGGKGGPETTTYKYYATFAVGLCSGPIDGISRIWIGNQLWYDAGSSDVDAIILSNVMTGVFTGGGNNTGTFTLYNGTDTQEADPLIQADRGVADVPAYRGLAYIVFDSLALEKYSNSLMGAQVKVEVVTSNTTATPQIIWTRDANSSTVWTPASWSGKAVSKPLTKNAEGTLFRTLGYQNLGLPTAKLISVNHTIYGDSASIADITLIPQNYVIPPLFAEGDFTFCSGDDNATSIYIDGVEYVTGFGFVSSAPFSVCALDNAVFIMARRTSGTPTAALAIFANNIRVLSTTFDSMVGGTNHFPYFAHDDANALFYMFLGPNVEIYSTVDGSLVNTATAAQVITADPCIDGGYLWSIENSSGTESLVQYDLTTFTEMATTLMPSMGGSATEHGWKHSNLVMRYLTIPDRPIDIVQLDRPSVQTVILGDIVQAECLVSNLLEASDLDVIDLTDEVRGYRVSQLGAIRNSIEPLRAAWPFDVVQHGYDIQFKKRGSASVATISADDLDARPAGQAPGIEISDSRDMDLQLPQKISIKYLDAIREYDINEQSEERANTDSVNHSMIDLPIVMNADEAKQTASMLLYMMWLERYNVAFSLPPEYLQLEPGDVITVNADNATYQLRLISINTTADSRLECKAKYESAAIYTQTSAAGEESQSTAGTLVLSGPTEFDLLDIPLMRDDDDTAGFPVAMTGVTTGWPGGALFRSDDEGQSWSELVASVSPGAVIGYASTTLSSHACTLLDKSSTLTVWVYSRSIGSVTEAQMFAGSNWFAYGADGRWEIIAAQTATLQGDGSYILRDFMRGQKGTEWATGLHAVNDRLVLLDESSLNFVSLNSSSIGTEKLYRAVTFGKTLDTDSDTAFTYTGVNLECLSPINLTGNNHSSNNWQIIWTRRSRYGDWRDYIDTPLGESSESYEIDIYDSGYTTLKRTLTSTTNSVTYSSANQVTDFGSNQSTIYCKIYQLSAAVGRGYPLTASITR